MRKTFAAAAAAAAIAIMFTGCAGGPSDTEIAEHVRAEAPLNLETLSDGEIAAAVRTGCDSIDDVTTREDLAVAVFTKHVALGAASSANTLVSVGIAVGCPDLQDQFNELEQGNI
ncbi:hypothetical protein ACFVAJ_16585 [Agromyces sp. NPDC057679]|uniref:hypothetical protein n=1 Tax=Agromyces sp. NPDC057679 TaxID=3346207 RepID=UPI0036718758